MLRLEATAKKFPACEEILTKPLYAPSDFETYARTVDEEGDSSCSLRNKSSMYVRAKSEGENPWNWTWN
jgi:hypothetical protein